MTGSFDPVGGLHSEGQVPRKVRRRALARPPSKKKLCRDDRNYVFIPFTIQGDIVAQPYEPMWRVDRDYWIAKITANIGRHDTGTHPDDGTPSGQPLKVQMQRVTRDLSGTNNILQNDSLISIAENHHQDVANDEENGDLQEGDFNIDRLYYNEHIYVEVTQVGSGRPGRALVVTAVLVPIPEADHT